jgi:hypothetical protein
VDRFPRWLKPRSIDLIYGGTEVPPLQKFNRLANYETEVAPLKEQLTLFVPCAEKTAEEDEFAEMIGIVVGDEKRFTEEVLAISPAEGLV